MHAIFISTAVGEINIRRIRASSIPGERHAPQFTTLRMPVSAPQPSSSPLSDIFEGRALTGADLMTAFFASEASANNTTVTQPSTNNTANQIRLALDSELNHESTPWFAFESRAAPNITKVISNLPSTKQVRKRKKKLKRPHNRKMSRISSVRQHIHTSTVNLFSSCTSDKTNTTRTNATNVPRALS